MCFTLTTLLRLLHTECSIPTTNQCHDMWAFSRPADGFNDNIFWNNKSLLEKYKPWKTGTVTMDDTLLDADCCRLLAGDDCEVSAAIHKLRWQSFNRTPELCTYDELQSCDALENKFKASNLYLSPTEMNYPIAYSLIIHTNINQVFRLLRIIYRTSNIYCINYDVKANPEFKAFFELLTSCFQNIFIAYRIEDVIWGHPSLLNAQLNCLIDLMKYRDIIPWKYVINLNGLELPLRTNREVVEMLQTAAGHNIIDAFDIMDPIDKRRFKYKVNQISFWNNRISALSTNHLGSIPGDLKVYKSECFVALTPPFVQFLLEDSLARRYFRYLQEVSCPEEYFYATMGVYYNQVLAHPVKENTIHQTPFDVSISRFMHSAAYNQYKLCNGSYRHSMCIFGAGDLHSIVQLHIGGWNFGETLYRDIGYGTNPRLAKNAVKALFLNKYDSYQDHTVMDCMEQRLVKQSMLEYYYDHHYRNM